MARSPAGLDRHFVSSKFCSKRSAATEIDSKTNAAGMSHFFNLPDMRSDFVTDQIYLQIVCTLNVYFSSYYY